MKLHFSARFVVSMAAILVAVPASAQSPVQGLIDAFENSDIVFQRSTSNVPFPPLGSISVTQYGDTELDRGDEKDALTYDQTNISQFALVPIPIGSKDLIAFGDWISWSDYTDSETDLGSFDVFSFGLPVGWLRQVNPDWQAAAFYMPLGHTSSLDDSEWRWEHMMGGFGRYIQTESLWWAFGVYANIDDGDNLYLPYLGASWSINDHWTIAAIMPWPAILYAPTENTLFRLGVSPSGASWSVNQDENDVNYDANSWDLGLSAEHRLKGNVWANLEIGLGGFRSISYNGNEFSSADLDVDTAPYIGFTVNLRPPVLN